MAVVLLAMGLLGCTSGPNVAATAPHSTVSRDNALALAKHVAKSIGGKVYAIAPSGSMLPTLDADSIVAVENVSLDKLRRGDIIIYRNGSGMVVIHRLYEQHADRWYVLGDNNASIDREMVSADNFIGRVCAIFNTVSDAARFSDATSRATQSAVASAR